MTTISDKNYVCIHNKIRKREYTKRPSNQKEKIILYTLFSPRVQVILNTETKEFWVSIEYLSSRNVKIESIKYTIEDEILTLTVNIDEIPTGGDKKTMSHLVLNLTESIKEKLKFNSVKVIISNSDFISERNITDEALKLDYSTIVTDPFEEFPITGNLESLQYFVEETQE